MNVAKARADTAHDPCLQPTLFHKEGALIVLAPINRIAAGPAFFVQHIFVGARNPLGRGGDSGTGDKQAGQDKVFHHKNVAWFATARKAQLAAIAHLANGANTH